MSPAAQKKTDEYQAFLMALQDMLGVVVGDDRHSHVLEKLKPVMAAHGLKSIQALAVGIRDESAVELRSSVLQAIASHESVWFSYPEIAKLLTDYVLPGIINKNRADYRIWLVGCGSGQIAYSQAMTIDAFRRKHNMACGIEIVATDISASTVRQAAAGHYNAASLDGLPEHYRQKFMIKKGDEWEMEPSIRSMLHFKTCSLLDGIGNMGHFDLVICPEVLIYFSNGVKKHIIDELADLLEPSGILILGANETVTPFSKRFEMINHEAGTFFRQLPEA